MSNEVQDWSTGETLGGVDPPIPEPPPPTPRPFEDSINATRSLGEAVQHYYSQAPRIVVHPEQARLLQELRDTPFARAQRESMPRPSNGGRIRFMPSGSTVANATSATIAAVETANRVAARQEYRGPISVVSTPATSESWVYHSWAEGNQLDAIRGSYAGSWIVPTERTHTDLDNLDE